MLYVNKYKEYTLNYRITHIIQGLILYCFSYKIQLILTSIILIYQFSQYFFKVRYYIHLNKFLNGNSIQHTLNKLQDYLLGYFIGYLIGCFIN